MFGYSLPPISSALGSEVLLQRPISMAPLYFNGLLIIWMVTNGSLCYLSKNIVLLFSLLLNGCYMGKKTMKMNEVE